MGIILAVKGSAFYTTHIVFGQKLEAMPYSGTPFFNFKVLQIWI